MTTRRITTVSYQVTYSNQSVRPVPVQVVPRVDDLGTRVDVSPPDPLPTTSPPR